MAGAHYFPTHALPCTLSTIEPGENATSGLHEPARPPGSDLYTECLRSLLPDPILRAVGARIDRGRFAALPAGGDELTATMAALANSTGGHVLLGALIDGTSGDAGVHPGIGIAEARAAVDDALGRIDPPISHLVVVRDLRAPVDDTPLVLVTVRQSPTPPHLVVPDGLIPVSVLSGVRAVRSRAELDALYQRGRSERERAERQIDAMIEKLLQAHYAFYGVGFVACTREPTAEPYLWVREHAEELFAASDPFCDGWKLTPDLAKARPGEVEVRGEKEAHGYVRVTRGGCVAVGEVRRRPPGNTVGSVVDVVRRIHTMTALTCRILAQAPAVTVVPRLFYEGMRGQKVIVGEQPYTESTGLELDTAQFPGNLGDPADEGYQRRITADMLTRLLAGFKVEYDDTEPAPMEA